MTSEREVEKSTEALAVGPKTDSLEVQNVTCEENVEPSPISPSPLPGVAGSNSRESITGYGTVPEQGFYYLPTTNPGDVYLGYNGTYPKWEGQGLYCMPTSYFTYAPGETTGFEDQSLGHQPYMSTSGYTPQTVFYGSEQMPVFARDSEQGAGYQQVGLNVCDDLKIKASNEGPAPSNLEDPNKVKTKITAEVKTSSKPLDSRQHQLSFSSKSPIQYIKSVNKGAQSSTGIQPVGLPMEYQHSTKISSPSYQGLRGFFPRNNLSGTRSTFQIVNNNNMRMRENSNSHTRYEASSELVIGPRADRGTSPSSSLKNELNPFLSRDHFNKPDFQTKYEQAKFFMIKSYSEDDIHKSIKYSVWSSTPNGNDKLDAAFREAEKTALEKSIRCPVFLFFSVNASGQFVGLAEMSGPVDFKKKMDFWQQDKWNGFFPVTWHIIKDIPNRNFQHITLENNENKSVTFSRDTQEIKLRQGLRMLLMFKSYPLRRSVLDDFDFYENREKTLHNTRGNQSALEPTNVNFKDYNLTKQLERAVGELNISGRARESHSAPRHTPANFTRNPSRNYRPYVNRSQ